MLYLVATPIGNLSDFSHRAIEVLAQCQYILCEDTRHSSILLKHYQIRRPLKSYHQFSEKKHLDEILSDLKQGSDIALISDAGVPLLCDPGHLLVATCRQEKIPVTAIGIPCAALMGLIGSGFSPTPFQFIGFLEKQKTTLHAQLVFLLTYQGTSIAYETPHRIETTLQHLQTLAPTRRLCLARELTKRYEEFLIGTPSELLQHFQAHPPLGEFVLILEPPSEQEDWSDLPLKKHVQQLHDTWDLSLNDAIKAVADMRGLPKRAVYQAIHQDGHTQNNLKF